MKTKIATAAVVFTLGLTGCSAVTESAGGPNEGKTGEFETETGQTVVEEVEPTLVLSLMNRKQVKIDQTITVHVADGEAKKVTVSGVRQGEMGQTEEKQVKLPGSLSAGVWTSDAYMEPSTRYTVRVKTSGGPVLSESFTTQQVPLARQTYPTLYPSGGTVGMAQPVVIRFDVPVANPIDVEEKLTVTTTPKQAGAWRWISSTEVRYRPKKYWVPGTTVKVNAMVISVPTGNGVYGQFDRAATFKIDNTGRRAEVNLDTQTMTVYANDKLVRTIPVSTGKTYDSSFITRTGTKIVMGHERTHRMRSSTIGISDGSPESYDLVVDYAMRLTNTGEFFHAADWNSGYFGSQGRSHGCTGMATSDAVWLYNFLEVGDPITYVSKKNAGYPDRPMTIDNGFGDWNMDFAEYKSGSGL